MARRKKQSAGLNVDREIERGLIGLMPELPRVFEQLAIKVEEFDGSQPRTFLGEIEKDLRPLGEKIKGREYRFQRFFVRFFGKFTARTLVRRFAFNFIKMAKTASASDKRYSLLLKLMHETDQKIPFASLIVAYNYADARSISYADQKAFFVAQSTAVNFYKRAAQASGEERATLALEAFAKTVELLYKPYLTALWLLSYIKVGKPPAAHVPELGSVMKVLVDRLPEYHGLLEQDAVWMRNSAVHNEPDYVLGEDSIWMWDRKHQRRKVRVDDLMVLTESLFVISTHTIQSVSQLYFFRECLLNTGLLDMSADCMAYELAGDQDQLKKVESLAKAHADSLFEPLQRFLNDVPSADRR